MKKKTTTEYHFGLLGTVCFLSYLQETHRNYIRTQTYFIKHYDMIIMSLLAFPSI